MGQKYPIIKNGKSTDYQQSQLNYFFGSQYNELVSKYNLPLSRMLTDVFSTYCQTIIRHLIVCEFFLVFLYYAKEHVAGVTR